MSTRHIRDMTWHTRSHGILKLSPIFAGFAAAKGLDGKSDHKSPGRNWPACSDREQRSRRRATIVTMRNDQYLAIRLQIADEQ